MIHKALQVVQLIGHLLREIVRLRPILVRIVELPDVIVERRRLSRQDPRRTMASHGRPTLVVDAAIAKHLEVLRFAAFGGAGVVEASTPC